MPIANRTGAERCFVKNGETNRKKGFSIFGFSEKRVGFGAHMVRAVHRPPQLISGNSGTLVPASVFSASFTACKFFGPSLVACA
jgi:hypothetical protein